MSKKNKSQVEDGSVVSEEIIEVSEVVGSEVSTEIVEEKPEVTAKKAEIATLEAALEVAMTAVKEQKKVISNLKKEIIALEKGEPVKSSKKYRFYPLGDTKVEELTMSNGKPLSYQGKLLVTIFNVPINEVTDLTKEEITRKLEDNGYPCLGDMFDNFSWYKTQVLKPMKLMD